MMNYAAVCHHAYDTFCYPLDTDFLRITIQTGRDIVSVHLIWGDPFLSAKEGGRWVWQSERLLLPDRRETQGGALWQATVRPPFKRCRYYFELSDGSERKYYFEDGFFPVQEETPDAHVQFIFPWMNDVDICRPPEWAARTVWY